MQASNEMEELLKRIYMPSVIYFPKVLFSKLPSKTIKELEEYQFFEDIGIIKVKGDISSLRAIVNGLEIYKKEGILEANLFQLLEMKERLGGESFGFLFDKYLSNVKAWIVAYNYLHDNFDKQFSETTKNEKSFFNHQCTTLDNHLIKLNQKFQFNLKNTPTTNLIDVLSKNKNTFPFGESLYKNLKGSFNKLKQNKEDKNAKKHEKEILLTDKEADEYLLKTVFNINTS